MTLGTDPEPVGDGVLAAAFNRRAKRTGKFSGLSPGRDCRYGKRRQSSDVRVACRVRYHRAKSRLASRLEAAASVSPKPKEVTR